MRQVLSIRNTLRPLAALAVAATLLAPAYGFSGTTPQKVAAPLSPVQAPASSAKQPGPAVIPLADVATQGTVVVNYLDTLIQQSAISIEVEAIKKQFDGLSTRSELDSTETTRTIMEQPTLDRLQSLEQLWQARQQKLTLWLTVLTQRATKLQDELNRLDNLQRSWTLTGVAAAAAKAPPQTIQQITTILNSIRTTQAPLMAARATLLDFQDLVAKELTRCGTELTAVTAAQQQAVGGIFVRNAPVLWGTELRDQARSELVPRIKLFAGLYLPPLHKFFVDRPKGMFLMSGLFLLQMLLLSKMRRRVLIWEASGDRASDINVFERPFAAALLITLLSGTSHWLPVPQELRTMMVVMSIYPMIRLTQPVVTQRLLFPLYTLGILFALDTIRRGLAGTPLLEQEFLLVEAVAGITVLWWYASPDYKSRSFHENDTSLVHHILRGAAVPIILVLAVSSGAVVLGYLILARLLIAGVLAGGIDALALFAFVRIMIGIVAFGLRVRPFNGLGMVSNHRDLLEHRVSAGLVLTAVGTWVLRTLDYVGLQMPVTAFVTSVLTARLQRESFSISLGDVIAFGLSLWLAFLLSSLVRFVLNEDVFPRLKTAPGVSYAVTSLLRYLLIILGFLVGLGELGVSLSRVIILISAFGVGMGFGLQNVVNNIVSGLLLLFERPIHIGDTVEFGEVLGNVKEIGLRASKVRSWRGADIIVPNSQLVSESVTNWTLSDQMRRIDMPVGVNYGADPRAVIGILESVALANPRIVKSPAPQGLMMEYGDSTINFELRAWTDNFQVWPQVRSDLAVAIYDAVRDAGMSFPFPQRDVHLFLDPDPDIGTTQQTPQKETTA